MRPRASAQKSAPEQSGFQLNMPFVIRREISHARDRRQEDFVNNLCRKLLSYALGRSLQPSDRATLDAMRARLAAENYAFGSLVDVIVNSPQFRNVK